MTDEEIIALYWNRSPAAITETDQKYRAFCTKISRNILRDLRDVEECISDSYLTVWNTIPPERPSFFPAFLGKIVRNLSMKKYNYISAEKRNNKFDVSLEELSGCFPSADGVEETVDVIIITEAINRFLKSQSKEKRVMFIKRYFFAEELNEIAEEMNITKNNVNVALHRLRRNLKRYLEEEEGIQI